MGNIGLDLI